MVEVTVSWWIEVLVGDAVSSNLMGFVPISEISKWNIVLLGYRVNRIWNMNYQNFTPLAFLSSNVRR